MACKLESSNRTSLRNTFPFFAHSLIWLENVLLNVMKKQTFSLFLSKIPTLFFASTHRWSLLRVAQSNSDQALTIKHTSDTRWSARADSIKAVFSGYSFIMQMLDNIVQDNQQKAECRQ